MAVKIRLSKTGKTHQISYRIVVQDVRTKRDGKVLENLGYFNPHLEKSKQVSFKKDRIDFWISQGAKPTPSVDNLISQNTKSTANAEK